VEEGESEPAEPGSFVNGSSSIHVQVFVELSLSISAASSV